MDGAAGPPEEPPFGDGKADVGNHVLAMGPLAFGATPGVSGEIVEDLEFHGYVLDVRAGAVVTLEITQRGSTRSLDSTLFVYGPRTTAGAYGTRALASDNDAGWGKLSKISRRTLAAAGSYLVVVGTHDARGRGNYRLEARCESGECGPVPPSGTGSCPAAFSDAIRRCAEARIDEADAPTLDQQRNFVEECSDVEIIAGPRDALCAAPGAPATLCRQSLEQLATSTIPTCRETLWNARLDTTCVFGSFLRDVWMPGALVVTSDANVTSASGLDATASAQLVEAVHETVHTDVRTAAEALAVVDGEMARRVDLWDATNRRAFTLWEVGAGDNSFGKFFDYGTTRVVARDHDTDIEGCTVTWGKELRLCATNADCAAGLTCTGVAEAIHRGRCIDTRAAHPAAEGASCTQESAASVCTASAGLLCTGELTGGTGQCRPAWMQNTFTTAPATRIPDNSRAGASVPIVVYGLASVDVDVTLDLQITHPRIADLTITLVNPAGTKVPVYSGTPDGENLALDHFVARGFPGDEHVNGVWRLEVVDGRRNETGVVDHVALTVASRWD